MVHDSRDVLNNLLAVARLLNIGLISGLLQNARSILTPELIDAIVQVFLLLDLLHLDILTGRRDEDWRLLESILTGQIQNRAPLHLCVVALGLNLITVVGLLSVLHGIVV